jgi:hypothetical protein
MAKAERIWRSRPGLAYRKLVDGGMLYDREAQQVHHFNETAACVWESCESGQTTAQIVAELCAVYEVDKGRISPDVKEILKEFGDCDLLK